VRISPKAKFIPVVKASIFQHLGRKSLFAALACAGSVAIVGCQKNDVQYYRVAKGESDNIEHPAASEGGSQDPRVQWATPSGWKAQPPSQMRLGSFLIPGNDGHKAEVSVIALPGQAGGEVENVNRWRKQINLPAVSEAELKSTEVVIGGNSAKLYDLANADASSSGPKLRTIAAWASVDDTSWFFKLSGDDDVVQAQRSAFEQFLKSVTFTGAPAATADATPELTAPGASQPPAQKLPPVSGSTLPAGHPDLSGPQWSPPKEWETRPASMMRVGSFAFADNNGNVDIAISVFPGDVGGTLANVNRWRSQVGVPPVTEEQLAGQLTPLDVDGGKAKLVEISGESTETSKKVRLIAVMVKKGDQTWFFKMVGDETTALSQKAAFVKFVQTSHLPNG
jgi:hypothetical protein